jgi:hypothetical protein
MNLLARSLQSGCVIWSVRRPNHFKFCIQAIALCVLIFAAAASNAQVSVTLGWDQSTNSAGYRVYQGTSSHRYTTNFDAGKNLQLQINGLTAGVTYYFAVCAYTSAGVYSDYSSEISYTASSGALPPPVVTLAPGVSLSPSAATLTAPFVLTGGMISQPATTTVTAGGSAVYQISNSVPGNYVISAQVKAPDTNSNSFYVNVDAQPTDPTMIWNLAVSSALTNETVSWQGISDSVPKVFFLAAGSHQVIVRGREANAQLGNITFLPAPFKLQALPNKQVVVSGVAQPSHAYDIQATTNFVTWTTLTNVTTDATGQFSFGDAAAPTAKARYYRLRG